MLHLAVVQVLVLLFGVQIGIAQDQNTDGQPSYVAGFSELFDQLGEAVMGQPVENEHPASDADAVQLTTTGLAVWRAGQPPAFTDGWRVWSLFPPLQVTSAPAPTSSPLISHIIACESSGDPGATNARTGAAGLGQFLESTWLTTPQGKAGLSRYDPVANRAAIAWMIAQGRTREFNCARS